MVLNTEAMLHRVNGKNVSIVPTSPSLYYASPSRCFPHFPLAILFKRTLVVIQFARDRRFGLFYIGERGLEGNTVRGREWEALSAGVPLIRETYFHGRIINVRFPRGR
jgi:hypothetical protein